MSGAGNCGNNDITLKNDLKASLFGVDNNSRDMLQVFSKPPTDESAQRSLSIADKRLMKVPSRYSVKERLKVISETDDPLSEKVLSSYEPVLTITKENLTIRRDDEARIVTALHSASKKQTTGSIYSVVVDLSKTGTLGIGVKDLTDHVLAVSMLKRENCTPGAGEDAGIRLGDIIFGVNFIPTREGTKTLISIIKKESARGKTHIHIQGWRCHQLCSDGIPGYHFPRADDVIVQAYALVQSKVFSDWERWNFIEILLGHMLEDLKVRAIEENAQQDAAAGGQGVSPHVQLRAKQMQVLDLERNILQAKGLRTALCVRIVHTKSHGDTVVYVLRVEDVESGLQWVVQRRYSDFHALNEELLDMSHFAREVEFPRKRLSIRNTAKLVETRIVALEQYMRRMLHILTNYATMDSSASLTLRHLQAFLGVDNYLDCVHPPALDDQRFIELMAYRFLNDFGSEACQQCIRFITNVDLDGTAEIGPEGYMPVLNLMRDALSEVEQFVQEQHMAQMIQTLRSRRGDLDDEQLRSFVRKCIRRQVEAALYLPLRRTVFRIVFNFLAIKSKTLQRAITLLQRASPKFLMVDPFVTRAAALPRTVKAFRRVIQAYLPADQGHLLIQAATAVMELHKECQAEKNRVSALSAQGKVDDIIAQDIETAAAAVGSHVHLRRVSDDVDFNFISTKTPDLDIVGLSTSAIENRKDTSDSELPELVRRPVVNKLRELFTRQKTSGDLFGSSDSDNEAGGAGAANTATSTDSSSAVAPPAAPMESGTPISSNRAAPLSTPNSPQRTAKFIQRMLPLSSSSLKNLDTADNLFVDEPQAFTVSVKSEHSSVQEHRSGGTSQSSSPAPPLQREISGTGGNIIAADDHDLHAIQKLTFGLKAASMEESNSPRTLKGKDSAIDSAKEATMSTHGTERAAAVGGDLKIGANNVQLSLRQDESVLANLHLPETPAVAKKVRGWDDDDDSVHAPLRTPNTNVASGGAAAAAAMSAHHKALLEALVGRQSEVMQMRMSHLAQAHAQEQALLAKAQDQAKGQDSQGLSKSSAISTSKSAKEVNSKSDVNGSVQDGTQTGSSDFNRNLGSEDNVEEDAVPNTRDSLLLSNSVEEQTVQYDAISADDFLPLFTYVLIQAGLPQLLLVKELMTSLVNDEDSYGECGYYLATMEAATQHIFDLAEQYERTVLAPQLSSSSIGSGGVGPLGGTGAGVGVIGALHGLDDNGEELIYGFDDKLLLP